MMNYQEAAEIVKKVLHGCGTEIDADNYDGIIVKKLAASNTLDEGRSTNQTHIAITGEQMDIFPYLCADGYFYNDGHMENDDLKKYFILRTDVFLFKTNCEYLRINDGEISFNEPVKKTEVCIVRSKRANQTDQLQLSMLNSDGSDFVNFRKSLHEGFYMIIAKCKASMKYHIFGINPATENSGELGVLNNKFYRMPTNTVVGAYAFDEPYGRKVEADYIPDKLSLDELGSCLREMYNDPNCQHKTTAIHMFGIKYGKVILEQGYSVRSIADAAGINESYNVEINKGINIYKSILSNEYGIRFEDLEDCQEQKDKSVKISGGSNILFYGVPGAGKSHRIDEIIKDSDYERVVFHPDYTYSDFVGQIMPRLKRDNSSNEKLTYEFVPGPFTKALKAAESNPGSMFYLVIEEINRGNAPAIFGDIFQMLDRNDDGSGKYSITSFDIAGEVYGDENEKIVMPSNLTILATMNTSDQNIFTLDTAFQRRWDMKYIMNNINGAEHAGFRIENSEITWGQFANTINKILADSSYELGNSEDKQLGAYFVKKDELSAEKFPEKVLKYLLNDAFRMEPNLIFDKNIKSVGDIIEAYGKKGDPIKRIMNEDVHKRMLDISAASPAEASDETEIFLSRPAE